MLWALLLATAEAQDSTGPTATVIGVDGARHTGPLDSFSAEKLALGGETGKPFATRNLLRVEFPKHARPKKPSPVLILLANGDRFAAEPIGMDEESLYAHWAGIGKSLFVKIPLETIRGIVLEFPGTRSKRSWLIAALLDRSEDSDLLILDNGDRLAGELISFDRAQFVLKRGGSDKKIGRDAVRAVGFNPQLVSFPKLPEKRVIVGLVNGSQITGSQPEFQAGKQLRFQAAFGAKISLPVEAVSSIRFSGERVRYLSDLKPSAYRFTPFLSSEWKLQRDRNVAGGLLSLRGTNFAKGLGMHSRSEVSYQLPGRFQTFRATAGIDDSTAGRGSVTFAVKVDGKQVFSSGIVTGKSPPISVGPIDVTGAKQITLIVDYGEFGDIQDHADWCDAVLISPR